MAFAEQSEQRESKIMGERERKKERKGRWLKRSKRSCTRELGKEWPEITTSPGTMEGLSKMRFSSNFTQSDFMQVCHIEIQHFCMVITETLSQLRIDQGNLNSNFDLNSIS